MFPISSVLLLSCLLQLALSASLQGSGDPQGSGDAQVIIYNDHHTTNTLLKVFLDELFLFTITLTKSDKDDYAGIGLVNVTQSFHSPSGVRKVTFGLEAFEDEDGVLQLTSLSPAIPVDDGSENFVSASRNNIFHSLVVTDKNNVPLPNRVLQKIVLTPVYSSSRIEISPKSS
uniref:Uncharacterized protein n=1 Tax=Cacopsylla melanoneura TaxID=428564 RepID=A0A8D8R8J2_9HEMI